MNTREQLHRIDIRSLEDLRGSFRDCRHRISGTAHHGLGGLVPDIERFFEARYWPSRPHPGIETGKLSSVGERRVINLKACCFADNSTSLCSNYGFLNELNGDEEREPLWRVRFWSDCSALVNILERNLSLIEQACASREAKYFAAIAEQKFSRTGFEILPALFGFAQRLGPELGLTVAEGGLFPKAGWMLPVGCEKGKALAFLRKNDPSLENLALSAFDADYEFSRHHRFALIENLPWTASLLADWAAGQLARGPSNSCPNREGERGKVAGTTGETHSKQTKAKRSTENGEGDAKLIPALTKHHKYAKDSVLNLDPIGNNELARLAGVSVSTASAFFKKQFGGHPEYKRKCKDVNRLIPALKMLNHEYSPLIFFGDKPPDDF
jgi:hypothetical protein